MPRQNSTLTADSNQNETSQREKIKLLEDELSRLTILENPLEIKNICESIIDIKKSIEKMMAETDSQLKQDKA